MNDTAHDSLDLSPDGPDWWGYASCPETDPEIFYPPRGASPAPARRVCMGCAVRAACLEYALSARISEGVWGGKTPQQRRAILRERRAA